MTDCTYTTPGGYQVFLDLEDFLASGEMNTEEHSADFLSFNVTYWGTTIIDTLKEAEPDLNCINC